MTQAEWEKLHDALFGRCLREVRDGSLTDAQKALEMMETQAQADALNSFLGDLGGGIQ